LWNSGPTVVAAILAFMTTGVAAIMLVHLLRMKLAGRLRDEGYVHEVLADLREVRLILGAALLAQGFTLFIWWLSLKYGYLGAQQALEAANAAYGPLFWSVGIGLGLVVPLLLGAYTMASQDRVSVRFEVNMIWITSGLILVGGFVFRLAVVLGGQAALPIHTLS
jgi:formate-dependent nitrite reductase membrane component NrfD